MTGQKKKLRYSEETPWFSEYYIGWIGIGNCGQETSTVLASWCYILNRVKGFLSKFNKNTTLNFITWTKTKTWNIDILTS